MVVPPNEEEQMALVKFREQLSDLDLTRECFTDKHLIRWLRARELNIPKAELMLRNNLEWKDANDIDTILCTETSPMLVKQFPMDFAGFDKDGGPVVVVEYGNWDLRTAIVKKKMKEEIVRMMLHYFEEILNIMKNASKNGKVLKQVTIIGDVENLSLTQFTSVEIIEVILTCVRAFEAHYPEALNAAYVVNAPSIFSILYGMAKPFLSEHTARKIQIFGPNSKKMTPALLEQIPIDQIPVKYGGTKHLCLRRLSMSNNFNGNDTDSSPYKYNPSKLIETVVNAGDKLNLEYEVHVPNTVLTWEFKTLHFDIGFSVKLIHNGKEKNILQVDRVNSHTEIQEGSVICKDIGSYVVSFDNTYSRMRSKVLHYAVNMAAPDTTIEDEKFHEL